MRATEDLLGEENCAWMIAWKPLQDSSAFRLYCKAIGMDISDYNDVAKNLDNYRDDKDWAQYIDESKKFVGVVESISESPCSMLLYDKPVRREVGIIRTEGKYCCLLDGYNCDYFKYLKNDYLRVMVLGIIKDTCELAGIEIPSIRELESLLDEETYKVYENGLTCSINQADSDFATPLVKAYRPKSMADMSAFVAIIRPGCASLRNNFIERKSHTTGISELDELLSEGEHRMIYQELIMKYLIWLGIKESESYDIIKKISKKKFKEDELIELKAKLQQEWYNKLNTTDGFEDTWKTVEQAASYSFNASHSLSVGIDSLYGAYLKSHYPLEYYCTALNYYLDDEVRTRRLTDEARYFNINVCPIKYGGSRDNYSIDKSTNSIYKGISSVKYMSREASEIIADTYIIGGYDSFTDLLEAIEQKTVNSDDRLTSRQMDILIKVNFFEEYGNIAKLLYVYSVFKELRYRRQLPKSKNEANNEILRLYSAKETKCRFSEIDNISLIKHIEKNYVCDEPTLMEKIGYQKEFLGYIDMRNEKYRNIVYVTSVNTKYSPRIKVYALANGNNLAVKISAKNYKKQELREGDLIRIKKYNKKPKYVMNEEGEYSVVPGETVIWLEEYEKILI